MTGKKGEVNIKRVVLSMSSVSSSHLPAHGGKRQLMVPEGRFKPENDSSWTNMNIGRRESNYAGFKGYGDLRSDYRQNVNI